MQTQTSQLRPSDRRPVFQPVSRLADPADNLSRLLKLLEQARAVQTTALLMPEAGYSPYRALVEAIVGPAAVADCA